MALTWLESGMLIERVVYVNCERKRTPKVSEGVDFLWWGTFRVLSNENIRAMLETKSSLDSSR